MQQNKVTIVIAAYAAIKYKLMFSALPGTFQERYYVTQRSCCCGLHVRGLRVPAQQFLDYL